jgi:hypothetical protein
LTRNIPICGNRRSGPRSYDLNDCGHFGSSWKVDEVVFGSGDLGFVLAAVERSVVAVEHDVSPFERGHRGRELLLACGLLRFDVAPFTGPVFEVAFGVLDGRGDLVAQFEQLS